MALISVSHAQLREPPLPGTYYSAKDFEWSPPWPFNPHPELEAAEIAPGIFVFDDTAVPDTPEQLAARAAHQAAVEHAKTIAANPALAEAERAARQAGQEAAWAKNRQRFLPTLHQPLIYRDGSPATMPGLVGGHRLLVAETLPQKQAEAAAKRQRAEQWAKQTGNPEIVPLEDGRAAYLEMVEDGLPVYKGSFNLNAARTISTDRVRPGGSTGLNLTGTNTFFGMWDEGAVRTTHTEFSGRVTPMDSVTNVNFHVSNQVVEVTVSNVTRTVDGDAEGFDTISPQASAKNILTVGAVFPISGGYTGVSQVVLAPFSSCGPTDDGRINPDVVADGISLITTDDDADNDVQIHSGTSFSA
ncbi:MAG: S8 family serine peptidase, partial [Verrucomicrobia bacterium]|nr:S8 family serine peptidase [Verrucomicrobiota bacterium]